MEKEQIDIVLPCFNPGKDWVAHIIDGMQALHVKAPHVTWHCILVNDGSARGIGEHEIQSLQQAIPAFTYIHYTQNRGKGYALRQGVARSNAKYTLFTDVDFPYTIDSVLNIYTALSSNHANIAIGVKDASYYAHVPPFRRFISKILRASSGIILRLKVSDTQCGLKGFDAAGRKLFLQTTIDRYLFDLEFVFLASRNKELQLKPVPVQLRDNVVFSSMPMRIILQESRNFLKIFIRSIFTK